MEKKHEVPEELYTERLKLRMPKPGDGEKVNAAIKASMDELKPWLGFVQDDPSPRDTEINIMESHIRFLKHENLRFLIFNKETDEFIGTTGFHNIEWAIPKMEIGYWIHTAHSGKGFMVEAVDALTNMALEGFSCRRVEIRCDAENRKSRAVPEKLGYVLEGILHNDELSVDGKRLTDTCVYAKCQ